MVIFAIACCHGNSLQYTHMNENEIPGVLPGVLLVLHTSSGVDTVKTVESHL